MSDGVDGAAAPVGGDTSTSAPSAPVGGPAPGGADGTQTSSAPAGAGTSAAEKAYTYKEDRSTWVPSHVVRERTERLQQIERELHYERQRVAALSGVQPPAAPEDPETARVREQFYKVFPALRKLEGMADHLEKLKDFDPQMVTQGFQQLWSIHGSGVFGQLTQKLKEVYGGAELPPKAVQRLQRLFVNELEDDPQLRDRYERGDLTVIDEFVKDMTSGVLDPYRRSTTVAQQPRQALAARLPRGGAGSAIAGGAPRPTVKPSDGDAFHKAAFARMQQEG